jgi:hypothetical protein
MRWVPSEKLASDLACERQMPERVKAGGEEAGRGHRLIQVATGHYSKDALLQRETSSGQLVAGFKPHRAILDTCPASSATVLDDAPSTLFDLDFEIAWGAFDGFQVCVSDQLDVHVPADLDQFGRDDSHGAVVGRKGLVQLGHDPADGGRFFQQVNVIAGVG